MKYLCIHSHFYQPPRENPWLSNIQYQPSADPYHDWNERINAQCYRPNAYSRLMTKDNKIKKIINNYLYMSFNFGPTLLSWLEEKDIQTYNKILEADKISMDLYNGHGNAIAQCYNHIIMPLASLKDKVVQVSWGIEDFVYRFGRYPEGMWLPETALDNESLWVLADYDIKYVILSPYQAKAFRELNKAGFKEGEGWISVEGGVIDPSKAYRYKILDSAGGATDKHIDIFFYDGRISKSIAFDGLLKDGTKLSKRLLEGYSKEREHAQLLNVATDGETYGHHFEFGEMCLSFAIMDLVENHGVELTNYGNYLSKHPPENEVFLYENTSWSCFHGIGRWQSDCGCKITDNAGWTQEWRLHLRKSLDFLKCESDKIYESGLRSYVEDVWEVRKGYIGVILGKEGVCEYIKRVSKKDLTDLEVVKGLKLLEMARQSLLMFTSCGWFFDDISGIETVQILKHACCVMEYAKGFGASSLEGEFLKLLNNAKSNVAKHGRGGDIYVNEVKRSIVSQEAIVAYHGIERVVKGVGGGGEGEDKSSSLLGAALIIYNQKLTYKDYYEAEYSSNGEKQYILLSFLEVESKNTSEANDFLYMVIKRGEEISCWVCGYDNNFGYVKAKVRRLLQEGLYTKLKALVKEELGCRRYGLNVLGIGDVEVFGGLVDIGLVEEAYEQIYKTNKEVLALYIGGGFAIDNILKDVYGYELRKRLNILLEEIIEDNHIMNGGDFREFSFAILVKKLDNILEAMESLKVLSDKEAINLLEGEILKGLNEFLLSGVSEIDRLKKIYYILDLGIRSKLKLNTWGIQNKYIEVLEGLAWGSDLGCAGEDREIVKELFKGMGKRLNFAEEYIISLQKD